MGAGVGAAGLAAAALQPRVRVGLVEIDAAMAALADENLALNGFAARGQVHIADLLDRGSRQDAGLADGMAEVVITNPPFFDPARARPSSDAGKRAAHVMPVPGPAALVAWVGACLSLLANSGTFIIIHRPEALPMLPAGLCRSRRPDLAVRVSAERPAGEPDPSTGPARQPCASCHRSAARSARRRKIHRRSRGDPSRRSAARLVRKKPSPRR